MKLQTFAIGIFILLMACAPAKKSPEKSLEKITINQTDQNIFNRIEASLEEVKNPSMSTLMLHIGRFLMETPYVAHTLEINETEQLVVNLREMDCTTFAENCLALSRTFQSKKHTLEKFTSELQKIRYRNGKITDYTSRIHYFSDWIYDNSKKKVVNDISKEIAETIFPNSVSFMSTHPDSYKQLKDNPDFTAQIAAQEKEISARKVYYIPEEKLASVESKLRDGDIVGITTNIKGLDISHVGILVQQAGRIHLMHASSLAMKVVISENTLEDYLFNSKSATGIMVVRAL